MRADHFIGSDWLLTLSITEKKQEKVKVEGTASTEGTPSAQPIPSATEDAGGGAMDVDKDSGDGQGKDGKDAKDSHAPPKKYRMSEAMKGIIWNLVCLSNECCRIENEKKWVCEMCAFRGLCCSCLVLVVPWRARRRRSANKGCGRCSIRK